MNQEKVKLPDQTEAEPEIQEQEPEWLRDIQDRSWEPELFISGGAIFFLLQVTDWLYHRSFIMLQKTGYYEPVVIANVLIAACNALILGFALHLIIRGLWVAAVTLSYVFPKGIQMEKIHYAEIFKKRVRRVRSTVEKVVLLETISSLMFTLSFLFFLIILGILITMLVIIPHSSLRETLGENGYQIVWRISYVLLFFAAIYLLDFLTLGYVKKQKRLAPFYHPIYVFFSTLTLAPFYRTPYYTLVSNIKPWIVIVVGILYLAIAFAFTQLSRSGSDAIFNQKKYLNIKSDDTVLDPRFYENLRPEEDLVQQVCIQHDIIEGNFVKLFIVHQKVIESLMSMDCDANSKSGEALLWCYADFYRIFLDDEYRADLKWRQFEHPSTKEAGLITFIPVKELPTGEHQIKIVLNVASMEDLKQLQHFGLDGATYARIPFWKN